MPKLSMAARSRIRDASYIAAALIIEAGIWAYALRPPDNNGSAVGALSIVKAAKAEQPKQHLFSEDEFNACIAIQLRKNRYISTDDIMKACSRN